MQRKSNKKLMQELQTEILELHLEIDELELYNSQLCQLLHNRLKEIDELEKSKAIIKPTLNSLNFNLN